MWWNIVSSGSKELVTKLINEVNSNSSNVNAITTELSLLLNELAQKISDLSGYSVIRIFVQDSNGNTNFQGTNSSSSITPGSIYAEGASIEGQSGIGAAQQMRAEVFNAFLNKNILWSSLRFSDSDLAPTVYLSGGIGNAISYSGCASTPQLILRVSISQS